MKWLKDNIRSIDKGEETELEELIVLLFSFAFNRQDQRPMDFRADLGKRHAPSMIYSREHQQAFIVDY